MIKYQGISEKKHTKSSKHNIHNYLKFFCTKTGLFQCWKINNKQHQKSVHMMKSKTFNLKQKLNSLKGSIFFEARFSDKKQS